jgi:hypothetical protein
LARLQAWPEGIVSKRKHSPYRSGRSFDWLKMKNPACAAVKREADEGWGDDTGRAVRNSGRWEAALLSRPETCRNKNLLIPQKQEPAKWR